MAIKERAGRLSAEQTLELWRDYRQTGDPGLRDRLVLTLAPMVKYIAYRKIREMPPQCEVDDFISCGLEALIRAIDRYDPDKGATLEQYAWTRIHGAVLDELRRNDWAPRSLRRWDREIGKARDNFLRLYGRRPTREELSDALGITPEQLVAHQDEIAQSSVGSLNTLVSGEEDRATETSGHPLQRRPGHRSRTLGAHLRGQAALPGGVRDPGPPRAQDRGSAVRVQPDAARRSARSSA